jgi:hypothetical protein
MVRDDTNSAWYPLTAMVNTTPGGGLSVDATNVTLRRFTDVEAPNLYTGSLSAFDNTSFDSTSYSRGYITIHYSI